MELQDHFAAISKTFDLDCVTVRYHPYAELKHTWKRFDSGLEFKVSDYLKGAPDNVLESLAWYLLSRACHRDCPKEKAEPYLVHAYSEKLWQSHRDIYFSRTRSLFFGRGQTRDLKEVFDYVNSYYFSSRIPDPTLAWSDESPRTRLGYYFAPLNLLVANKALDSTNVPRYVLEFVVYHELLHHIDRGGTNYSRRIHHTKSFRQTEALFSHFDDAERWLRKLVKEAKR